MLLEYRDPGSREKERCGLSLIAATGIGGRAEREQGKNNGAEISACAFSVGLIPERSVVIDRNAPPWTSATSVQDTTPTEIEFLHRHQY